MSPFNGIDSVCACADEIANGLVCGIGHPDGFLLTGSELRRAKFTASRRSVLMRTRDLIGIMLGVTTMQLWPQEAFLITRSFDADAMHIVQSGSEREYLLAGWFALRPTSRTIAAYFEVVDKPVLHIHT